MRKALIVWSIAALVLSVSGVAMADMTVRMYGGANAPYTAVVDSGSELGWTPNDSFATFCLEKNEYFHSGYLYVASIDAGATQGGVGGSQNGSDPLGISTAWVYDSYLNGDLDAYHPNEVQNVIWYLENELTSVSAHEQTLVDAAQDGVSTWNGDFHGVWVMNLSGFDFPNAQSQLIREKGRPNPPVPAPGAALLGLIGIGTVGWIKRRLA